MIAPTGTEQRHYQQLVGGTVTEIAWDVESFGEATPVLKVLLPSGRVLQCVVLCDPEGNGPGFLDIADWPA
jgi:hypothetical protein